MRRVALFALLVVIGVSIAVPVGPAAARAAEVDELATRDTDVEVFMEVRASPRQINRVRRALRASSGVRRLAFVDHDDAYDEFKRIFRDQPKLVKSIRPADLPTSFRVDTLSDEDADALAFRAEDLAGVDSAEAMYRPSVAQMLVTVRRCRQRGASFEAFMVQDATQAQLDAARDVVDAQPGVSVVRVLDHDDAFTEFTTAFASLPDKFDGIRPEDLPMSIRFEGPNATEAMEAIRDAPGVEWVQPPGAKCAEVFRLLTTGSTEEQVALELIERRWGTKT